MMKLREKTDSTKWQWLQAADYISAISFFDPPSLFAKTISETIPAKVDRRRLLDIGCGSGVIGICCLLENKADFVTFTDIQYEAVTESCSNVVRQIERGKIRVDQVEFMEPARFVDLPLNVVTEHDLIVFNPPQLPASRLIEVKRNEIQTDSSKKSFRDGGSDGLEIARQFFEWYARLAQPKPEAVILLSCFLGRSLIEKSIRGYGLPVNILCETRVPLRPIFTDPDELPPHERIDKSLEKKDGKWWKTLLTISLAN